MSPSTPGWFTVGGLRLVGNHPLELGLIAIVGDRGLVQVAFSFARLRRQDVATESVCTNHFPSTGFLEAFGRAFVGL